MHTVPGDLLFYGLPPPRKPRRFPAEHLPEAHLLKARFTPVPEFPNVCRNLPVPECLPNSGQKLLPEQEFPQNKEPGRALLRYNVREQNPGVVLPIPRYIPNRELVPTEPPEPGYKAVLPLQAAHPPLRLLIVHALFPHLLLRVEEPTAAVWEAVHPYGAAALPLAVFLPVGGPPPGGVHPGEPGDNPEFFNTNDGSFVLERLIFKRIQPIEDLRILTLNKMTV